MQPQQFIDILKQPTKIETSHLVDLEVLVREYPFFETAHLLYTKGLHKTQSLHYSKQLRKTAIVANSRSVLYDLIHQTEPELMHQNAEVMTDSEKVEENKAAIGIALEPTKYETSPITITNNDIKVIYVNTVPSKALPETIIESKEEFNKELNIVKTIENETDIPVQDFDIDKINKTIEQEISKGIVQSYVQTDIIKTQELNKENVNEPSSFTGWLKTIQKEAHTFQIDKIGESELNEKKEEKHKKIIQIDKKSEVFDQKKQLIDKIIESDPGRIKLGTNKFFTPATEAKQSLLENEHLVTETLAKIYALQGNISKAIRAYEILSLKFPQKSVYFASLIEKLKTNK